MRGRVVLAAAASVCVLGLSEAVLAADLPYKAPAAVVQPAPAWTGFYLGLAAGYTRGNVTLGTIANPNASGVHPDGFVFAGVAGYDYQFANNIVLGARLTVPLVSSVEDQTFSVIAGTDIKGESKWAVIATGRLGYAIGNVLPYVTAGYAVARGKATSVGFFSAEATHTGYVLGGGVEYAFSPHWSIDVNYSYISLSKADYVFPFSPPSLEYGFNSNNLMVGVNYRF